MNEESQKIKLVVGISDFRIGGAQKIVADVLQHFDQDVFEIHLVTFFQSPKEETFYSLLPKTIVVHRLDFSSFRDVASWKKTYQLLREVKPDVVWSHLFFSNTVLRILKPLFLYKVVIVEHNTYPNQKISHRLINRLLAHFTSRIVGVSAGVIDFLVTTQGVRRDKCVVIHNGVDVKALQSVTEEEKRAARSALGLTLQDKVVITVGQFIRQKNHLALIEAFALFRKSHPDYHLVIIGDGALRPTLEAKVIKLGLEGLVHMPGIKKPVAPFLAISDFFVLPSLFEGFGIVCIEAMAGGLPVVATKVTGPDNYIIEGENGFFSQPDPESLSKQMHVVAMLDETARSRMTSKIKETAQKYSIEAVTKEYESLLVACAQ